MRRTARFSLEARKAFDMASTTSGPVRMLPWTAWFSPVSPPAQSMQFLPVKVAVSPVAEMMPSWRSADWGSDFVRESMVCWGLFPFPNSFRPSEP